MSTLAHALVQIVGERYVSMDADVLAGRTIDHTGRYLGTASILIRPGTAEEVAEILKVCKEHSQAVTTQGGRTSMVAGTVSEHDDVLLSTERLTEIGPIDTVERRVRAGSGVTLAALQQAAAKENLQFGVDIGSRDSATLGGMASTNAGACVRCATETCANKSSEFKSHCPMVQSWSATAMFVPTTQATT